MELTDEMRTHSFPLSPSLDLPHSLAGYQFNPWRPILYLRKRTRKHRHGTGGDDLLLALGFIFAIFFISYAIAGATYTDWEWVWYHYGDPVQSWFMNGIPIDLRW